MRLSEIFSTSKTVEVTIGDGKLAVTYRPDAVTPELVDRMNNTGSAPGEAIATSVVELVESWDLTDNDGQPYPLTVEAVRKLPVSFLSSVTNAITDDINPNARKRKA